MVLMLLKDVLSFAWRHRLFLLTVIGPIILAITVFYEVSGGSAAVDSTMNRIELTQMQGQEATDQVGLSSDTIDQTQSSEEDTLQSSDEYSIDNESNVSVQDQFDESSGDEVIQDEPISPAVAIMFLIYLAVNVYPAALVIIYIRNIFAAESGAFSVINKSAPTLWIKMLGIYLLVWGGLLFIFASGYGLLHAILGNSSLVENGAIIFGLAGIYVHHRLSLAPIICANSNIDLIDALKLSWKRAHGYVMSLILGHILLYFLTMLMLYMINTLLIGIISKEYEAQVIFILGFVGSLLGALQTIYVYRLYSYIEEQHSKTMAS